MPKLSSSATLLAFDTFGTALRYLRRRAGLSQRDLSIAVGYSESQISRFEGEHRPPDSATLRGRFVAALRLEQEPEVVAQLLALADAARAAPGPDGASPVATHPRILSSEKLQLPSDLPAASAGDQAAALTSFVGREQELTWLEAQLKLALAGQGRLVFIAGEAGRGKTALMAEFMRRALRSQPDLLAVGGSCSALAGTGDPYLPFREAMGLLTGEVETRWTTATDRSGNARRLWQALATTLPVLVEFGPQLIDVFVPAKGLLTRAQAAATAGSEWLSQLQSDIARRSAGVLAPEQSALFGQFTDVLRHLAQQHPLLLTLDDLHWADEASLGLLFHLSRRLSASRVLILGAYRPEELAARPAGERHPLEAVVSEVKRTYGQVSIDLAQADEEGGRDFVNALLDTEPNRLSPAFRQAFFQQTGGHPLFTVELLREMQTQGYLVQGEQGRWYQTEAVNWKTLPARVEAVIAQRLSRLDSALWDMLSVASVEGELFTAEVVAQVQGLEERLVLHQLSQQLGRRHRLVRESGEVEAGDRFLSPYQFSHALFQQYLYEQLDPAERRRLHGAVAGALETLYRDRTDEISVQLARHFQEARMPQKAVAYLQRAGDRAMKLAALEEAITLLRQGLALLKTLPDTPEHHQQELRLRLSLGEAHSKAGPVADALEAFQGAAAIALELGRPEALAGAALGLEEACWRFNLPMDPAIQLLRQTLAALGPEQAVLRVRLQVSLVRALMSTTAPEQFARMSQEALDMARRANDPVAVFNALHIQIWGDRRPERSAARMAAMDEMSHWAETTANYEHLADTYGWRMQELAELGALEALQADYNTMLRLSMKLRQPLHEYWPMSAKTMLHLMAGRFDEAERLAVQTLNVGRQLRVENVEGMFGIQMFTIRREQGRLREVAPLVQQFEAQHAGVAVWRPGLALIYSDLGLWPEARQQFEQLAANDFAALPQDALWATCLAYLAEVCADLGAVESAARLYQLLLPYAGRNIVAGLLCVCYGAAAHYLGRLAATMDQWVLAEQHFEAALAMNRASEAWPWLAHTQHQYAVMLAARGRALDQGKAARLLEEALATAQRLGMKTLADKVTVCQRRITHGEN